MLLTILIMLWRLVNDLPSSNAFVQMKSAPEDEPDEFDDLLSNNTGKSLAARIGNSPDAIAKKQKAARISKKSDGLKQTKLSFSPKKVTDVEHTELRFTALLYSYS